MPRSQMRASLMTPDRLCARSLSETRSAFAGRCCATTSVDFPHCVERGAKCFRRIRAIPEQACLFWSNSSDGKRHRKTFRARYRHPCNVGLRCDLRSLRDANPGVEDSVFPVQFRLHAAKPKKESPLPEFIPAIGNTGRTTTRGSGCVEGSAVAGQHADRMRGRTIGATSFAAMPHRGRKRIPPTVIPEFSFRPRMTPALPCCVGGMKISGISADRRS